AILDLREARASGTLTITVREFAERVRFQNGKVVGIEPTPGTGDMEAVARRLRALMRLRQGEFAFETGPHNAGITGFDPSGVLLGWFDSKKAEAEQAAHLGRRWNEPLRVGPRLASLRSRFVETFGSTQVLEAAQQGSTISELMAQGEDALLLLQQVFAAYATEMVLLQPVAARDAPSPADSPAAKVQAPSVEQEADPWIGLLVYPGRMDELQSRPAATEPQLAAGDAKARAAAPEGDYLISERPDRPAIAGLDLPSSIPTRREQELARSSGKRTDRPPSAIPRLRSSSTAEAAAVPGEKTPLLVAIGDKTPVLVSTPFGLSALLPSSGKGASSPALFPAGPPDLADVPARSASAAPAQPPPKQPSSPPPAAPSVPATDREATTLPKPPPAPSMLGAGLAHPTALRQTAGPLGGKLPGMDSRPPLSQATGEGATASPAEGAVGLPPPARPTTAAGQTKRPSRPPVTSGTVEHTRQDPWQQAKGTASSSEAGAAEKKTTNLTEVNGWLARVEAAAKEGSHYSILQLPENSTDKQIQERRMEWIRSYHPDLFLRSNMGAISARLDGAWKVINMAATVLLDKQKRKEHDTFLERRRQGLPTDVNVILEAERIFKEGDRLLKGHRYDEALERFARAIQLNGSEPEFQVCKAWSEYMKAKSQGSLTPGLRERAKEQLKSALASQAKNDRGHYFLGIILKEEGKEREARAYFNEALSLNPYNVDAKREIRMLSQKPDEKKG
ncbi:MAG: tetratricopeptide repeat protein, partial [Deltaproteobacteria bacterium]|nr:tetratricopeptide repeat protein [Deltaproteobacteria bacterium]